MSVKSTFCVTVWSKLAWFEQCYHRCYTRPWFERSPACTADDTSPNHGGVDSDAAMVRWRVVGSAQAGTLENGVPTSSSRRCRRRWSWLAFVSFLSFWTFRRNYNLCCTVQLISRRTAVVLRRIRGRLEPSCYLPRDPIYVDGDFSIRLDRVDDPHSSPSVTWWARVRRHVPDAPVGWDARRCHLACRYWLSSPRCRRCLCDLHLLQRSVECALATLSSSSRTTGVCREGCDRSADSSSCRISYRLLLSSSHSRIMLVISVETSPLYQYYEQTYVFCWSLYLLS